MNKKFFKILTLGFVLLYTTGCDNFLDKEVLGYSTDENFYDTNYKLQAALNATYDVLQMELFNECDWRFGEACADDVVSNREDLTSDEGQLVNFRFTTSNKWIENRYSVNYKGIHRANQVIANAHKVRITDTDYETYKSVREILGQAKFLRALYYFNLVKTYGGVPIRPEIEKVDSLVIPRSSAEEVYAYIEKDLREAAIMLPPGFSSADWGKATETAAVALLMKVLMYQATPGEKSEKWEEMMRLGEFAVDGVSMTFGEILKYDPAGEDWEAMRKRLWFKPREMNEGTDPYENQDTQLNLLAGYGVDLTDRYGKKIEYIEQFFQAGEFCTGSVFEIVFKESADGTLNDDNEGTAMYYRLCNNQGWENASRNPEMWVIPNIEESLFENDNRRLYIITHHQGFPIDGENYEFRPGCSTSSKWYTPVKERSKADENGERTDDNKNRRLIRFAEVVLMYAEALNECGFGERALNELNKTKTLTGNMPYSTGGYGYMRNNIWKERRIELSYEWDRFFDLVRQKRAAEVLRTYGATQSSRRGLFFREGVNEIFPIPQKEIDISNGLITQNPGY